MNKIRLSVFAPAFVAAALLAGCSTQGPATATATVPAAKSDAAKPAPPLKPQQRVDALLKKLANAKSTYSNRIERLSALLAEPDFATNAANAAYVRLKVLDLCFTPAWTSVTLWEPGLANIHVEPNAHALLADKNLPPATRIAAAAKLARYLAGEERHAEAEKVARDAIAITTAGDGTATPKDLKARALFILADVFRWQDRFEDAMATLIVAMPFLPGETAAKASGLARDFCHEDTLPAIWRAANVPFDEFDYYADYRLDFKRSYSGVTDLLPGYTDVRRRALDYVVCATNPPARRFHVACSFFLPAHDDDARKAIDSLRGTDFSRLSPLFWWDAKIVTDIFIQGDNARFAELGDIFCAAPFMNTESVRLARVAALGACGRAKEGAALAAKWADDEKATFSNANRLWLRAAADILAGRNADGIVEGSGLPAGERAKLFAAIAGVCCEWGRTGLAESFAARHDALIMTSAPRVCNVTFSEKPILSADDWRRLWPRLEKHHCDIKFQGSLQFLETDVATGVRREVALDKDGKPFSFMEMTAACDVRGLHIFLRLETDQARAIERGFGNAGTCETYLAAGVGQPYTCIGVGPRGIEYTFQTTYDNPNQRRLDTTGRKARSSFSAETFFTDTDYTIHLFYAWEPFAGKLPAPGRDWRFDCLSTQPFGRYSWGGSQGVHSASAWGSLHFDLKPAQLADIRRRLIYSTFRGYANISFVPSAKLNLFDYWKDPAIGDPGFYEKCLRPLEQELKGYADRVKEDMTDDEVNEIFTKGLVRWITLRDTIEGLHRRYLAEKYTD